MTSGLCFDTATYHREYKNLNGNFRWASKMNKMREKVHTVRPAGLKTRRSFSYTIITKNSFFLTVLLLFAQCKMHYWWLVTWLDFCLKYVGSNLRWVGYMTTTLRQAAFLQLAVDRTEERDKKQSSFWIFVETPSIRHFQHEVKIGLRQPQPERG
jgi:hypothetical protein